ncbi:MAG: zinc transporter ZntB [Roseivivax sp.]|nr:zinc transporter ZntB [Roseivivax sp.]
MANGTFRPVTEPWPEPAAPADASWRWLHFDVADPGLKTWERQMLPRTAGNALVQQETRPRCEALDDGLILNLRGVNLNPGQATDDMVSLRLWVTERCVVSARVRKVFAAEAMRERIETGHVPKDVGSFLELLIDELTDRIEAVSVAKDDETDTLEDKVFDHSGAGFVDVGPLRGSVIKLRRYVHPQRDALQKLAMAQVSWLGQHHRPGLMEAADRTTRIVEELDAARDRLSAMQDHMDTRQAARFGRNSYILSAIAALFLPLGFLTGLFGVNVAGMPGADSPMAFWQLTGVCVVIGIALWLFLRWKRWL